MLVIKDRNEKFTKSKDKILTIIEKCDKLPRLHSPNPNIICAVVTEICAELMLQQVPAWQQCVKYLVHIVNRTMLESHSPLDFKDIVSDWMLEL